MLDEVRPRSVRKAAVTPLFLALVVSLAGIRDAGAAPPVEKDPNPLVLYHWWGSSSEMAALNALAAVFKTKYPGVAEKRTVAPDRGGSLFVIEVEPVHFLQIWIVPDTRGLKPAYGAAVSTKETLTFLGESDAELLVFDLA
jgi:hypothetical protein